MSALLPTRMVERPWGRGQLPPPFTAPAGQTIGEVWFEPPPALSELLVKYIFTSQALSVQVHPSDAQLPGHGKEECWLVIAAEPGAKLGIGFREALGAEAMRAAALDGSIENLMEWHDARPGDFFHIPPGTVHAIGAGIALIEVQQNSDVTYRLYDYGRPRELHLDAGVAVARGEPYPANLRQRMDITDAGTLVEGPHFRMDQIEWEPSDDVRARYGDRPVLVIPRWQHVTIGGEYVEPGECGWANRLADIEFYPLSWCLIVQPVAG